MAARRAKLQRRLRNPPGHWGLLALGVIVVLAATLFAGVATHTIGSSRESAAVEGPGASLPSGRALFMARDGNLVTNQPPPGRRIALTFDDGPDPKWTPKIAAVLAREGVTGTFFVVGSEVAHHPDLLRMLVREGHEIGNHTFTHVQLADAPAWQRRLQLDLTEAVIVGITGRYTRFLRPPYSGTSDAVTTRQEEILAEAAGSRYLVALANFDSDDWKRPGVARIVERAMPRGRSGGVIMFHDGGGDRSETVAALSRLIPLLRARGFRFVSLAELSGLPEHVLYPTGSASDRRRGRTFVWAVRSAFFVTDMLAALLIGVGALVAARVLVVFPLAAHHARSRRSPAPGVEQLPSIVIVVPAYNESVVIERTVRSLAASDYPGIEIVVVDDGSVDGTGAIVEGLGLENVRVLHQENAGKAAALNAGIRASTAEIVVMVDADTIFEQGTLRRLVQPLADPKVGAVSGNTKVGNRRTLVGRWQHIEYVVGFNLDRRMYDVLRCIPTVPGAVGAFRRDALDGVGGVSGATLAEDTDLTLALGRKGWSVIYTEDAHAWTEAPSTLGGLWRQRYRWSYGTIQAVWKHKRAILSRDRQERLIGRRALPYLIVFQILLPLAAPLIDLVALYGLLFTDPVPVAAYWVAFNLVQLSLAVFAFRLDGESLRPLWALPLQQFVYRQLMYLVIIESTISALVGVRARWLHVPRTGDVEIEGAT